MIGTNFQTFNLSRAVCAMLCMSYSPASTGGINRKQLQQTKGDALLVSQLAWIHT
jgi:hypothetical protein